jgi:hypothetical protein
VAAASVKLYDNVVFLRKESLRSKENSVQGGPSCETCDITGLLALNETVRGRERVFFLVVLRLRQICARR